MKGGNMSYIELLEEQLKFLRQTQKDINSMSFEAWKVCGGIDIKGKIAALEEKISKTK